MDLPTGPCVVLTREPEDNQALAQALRARAIPVCEIPCVATRYLQPAAMAVGDLAAITFSSRRGVRGFAQLDLASHLLAAQDAVIIATVGKATAAEAEVAGWKVDLVADPPEGEVLARMLLTRLQTGDRVLTVRGNLRAGKMDAMLREADLTVVPLEVYENQEPVIALLPPFPVAGVFAASPSAARRLLAKNPWFQNMPFFVIGRTSATAVAALGVSKIQQLGAQFDHWVEQLDLAYRQAVQQEKS